MAPTLLPGHKLRFRRWCYWLCETNRYDEVAFCDMTIIQNFGKNRSYAKEIELGQHTHTHTHTHTHSVVVTDRFALSTGRRIKTQCIIHVWYIHDLGPDHRVGNELELQSHSMVLPFTVFFPLFSPFLHNHLSAHSSSSSKSRSSLLKILYRQSDLLYIYFFVFRLFMCFSLQSAILRAAAVPLQAWSGPEGSRKLRFPDFMTTAQDGG